VLLAGAIIVLLLVGELLRRLAASPTVARTKRAMTAPAHVSAADTVIALAVVKDLLHAIGIRVFRSPARSAP
jgi:hypothetical protein